MNETIRNQSLAIRDTGLTMMFDVHMVQRLAFDRNYFELVNVLEELWNVYVQFILYGDE